MAKKVLYREVNPVPTDYVAYYKFNSNTDDETTNYDLSVSGGVAYTSDRFGNTNSSIVFGSDAYLYSNTLAEAMDRYYWTISTNVYCDDQSSTQFIININSLYISKSNHNILVSYNGSGIFTESITEDIYHNFTLVKGIDGSNFIKLYVDGILIGTVSTSSITLSDFQISRTSYEWGGNIDDVRIYNRSLSEKEIRAINNISK